MLGRRQARHPRDPVALPKRAVRLAEHADAAVTLVAGEHLLGPVGRAVIRHDHEIDAGREMEGEVLLDDVALVADEQGHDDRHEPEP